MDELTTKRLAIIKQLYLQGINQSYDPEPMNGFCILSFHDSVEMFMKLCAEKRNIKINRDVNFEDYFTKIPGLLCNATMANLNKKRVNLKHYGSLPSVIDIEISRANVSDFFEQNTPVFFGVKFDQISLVSLIKYNSVKDYLNKSLDAISKENFEEAILNAQKGFRELLYCHKEEISLYSYSSDLSEDFNFLSSSSMRLGIDRKLDEFIDKVEESILEISKIVNITRWGIDYKKYCEFELLSPHIQVWFENNKREYESLKNDKIICNKKNAQFCFDFVIDSALKLQRFSFDVKELRKK